MSRAGPERPGRYFQPVGLRVNRAGKGGLRLDRVFPGLPRRHADLPLQFFLVGQPGQLVDEYERMLGGNLELLPHVLRRRPRRASRSR